METFTIKIPEHEKPINLKVRLAELDKMRSALSHTDDLL